MNDSSAEEGAGNKSLPARKRLTRLAAERPAKLRTSATPAGGQPDNVSPAFILGVFRKWWKLVFPAGVALAGAAAALVLYFHKLEYEANALISIEASAPFIAFAKDQHSHDSGRYIETQIELLRSPVVLGPVLATSSISSLPEFKTVQEPVGYLQKHLVISQIGKSDLYDVRYTAASADAAATVVNEIIGEYLDIQSGEDFRQSQRVIEVLEEERVRRSGDVQQLRQRVLELAKNVTGRDPFGQGALVNVDRALSPIGGLYESLTGVDVNIEMLKADIQALRDSPALMPDQAGTSGILTAELANRADVRELQAMMDALDEKMINIRDAALQWETDPEYIELKARAAKRGKQLASLKATIRKELLEERAQRKSAERAAAMAENQRKLATLEAQRKLLTEKLEHQMGELKAGGAQSVQLEFARAELEREERVFELIASRKLALQTELRAPARVMMRQAAKPPLSAIEPVPYKILILSCLAALFSPLALAVAREATLPKISTSDQLAHDSLLPVLGEIARFPVRPVVTTPRRLSHRAQREMFMFAESIDSVRTSLMLSEALRCNKESLVLAVCSASSGEGKTSVATSLAVSFAGATRKPTLLIDADLRAPDASAVLGVPEWPGLAEVLAGKVSLDDALRRVGETETYVLPAGRTKSNPHFLVQPPNVVRVLKDARAKFSCVIIDTPPVLSACESLVYAKSADLVLYCSLRDVSRGDQVRTAVRRLQDAGASMAGAVLSGMPASKYAYFYGVYGEDP